MKASDILLAACDVIEWQGWHKGQIQVIHNEERVDGGAVCIQGALICATTGNSIADWEESINGDDSDEIRLYVTAKLYFRRIIGIPIAAYNDRQAKSKDEVIATLIEAAQLAANDGN